MFLDFIMSTLVTVLNTENTTLNNVGFVVGLTVLAGLLVFGILNLFLHGFVALMTIVLATAFLGYRVSTSDEMLPTKERMTTTTVN